MRPPPPLLPHPLGLEDISGSGKWSTTARARLNCKEKENEKKNSKFPAKMKFCSTDGNWESALLKIPCCLEARWSGHQATW